MPTEKRATLLVFAAVAAWGALFIFQTSFDFQGVRYFVLFDDAMISMSFAKNLVAGRGLVWSPGEAPVEGFTNPLWTLAMGLANLPPVPLAWRSAIVQVTGLALLLATLWRLRLLICRHFADGDCAVERWLPAVVLSGFHYSLMYWSVLGMETPLQALLIVLAVHYAYDIVFEKRDRSVALGVVFTLAYLTRMDMLLTVAVVTAWIGFQGGYRVVAKGRAVLAASLFLAAVGGYQIFRWLYFGEMLPNTYYLKMGGVPLELRLPRGGQVLGQLLRLHVLPALAVLAGLAAGLARKSRTLLPGLLILVHLAYTVWVGGDAWELPDVGLRVNRFVSVVLPLAFLLVNALLDRVVRELSAGVRRAVAVAATSLVLLLVNGLWLSERAEHNWNRMLLAERPPLVESQALVLSRLIQFQGSVADGAEVVTYWAGIPAFFGDYRLIDAYGYNDPVIARVAIPSTVTWKDYRPGHNKTDPFDLLNRRPDAFFQYWDLDRLPFPHPRRAMKRRGYVPVEEFWVRRDSPYLRSPLGDEAPAP